MATGRTVGKYFKFQIKDAGGSMRDIPVSTCGGVGVTYEEIDVSALQDVLKGGLAGQGSVGITITGPLDTTAAVTASASTEAPALSGSHTVLPGINGNNVGRSAGFYIGIHGYWTATTDPVFGGVGSFIVSDYTVDMAAGTYSANIMYKARATVPAWGVAAIAAT